MINNLSIKNKDDFFGTKLNNEKNVKKNYLFKQNIFQIIKKNEINISNFDPIKYKRSLLNLQNPKKVLENKNNKKCSNIKKNDFNFFGPYNRYTNSGGGFCKRLNNKALNLELIYEMVPKNIPKYKQNTEKYDKSKMNIHTYTNNNNRNENVNNLNKQDNILIQENDIDNNINKTNPNKITNNDKKIYNIRYNLKNYKRNSFDKKLNLVDVNNCIKYLKLNPNIKNSTQSSTKELSIKNKKGKKINMKKSQTKKTYKKIYEGIKNNYPKIIKKLELNSIPTQTPEELFNTDRILVKDNIEQFSMKKNDIKKFVNLTEGDNVLLEFSSNKKDKYLDYAICSDRFEFQSIIKAKKTLPENQKKLIIKVNELEILATNSKIKNDEIISINKIELDEKDEKEIIKQEEKDINKEIIKQEEKDINKEIIKDIKTDIISNKNDEIPENKITKNIEIEEDKRSSKAMLRLSKHKERIKRKNEKNEKEKVNTRNKIKNLALQLENQIFKRNEENEDDIIASKDKIEKKDDDNDKIPVVTKNKMQKKIFEEN